MACTQPLKGYWSAQGGFTFSSKDGFQGILMEVPCGQCMGCRLAKTADWATRITQEAQLHNDNAFITLTYNDEKYPAGGTLVKEHLQRFFKRLRKYLSPTKIRYFAAGEYGDKTQRPHYHSIIFNYWPEDCETYKKTSYGTLWTSPKLEKLWSYGFVTIGAVTYETAAYTASYVTKKINPGMANMNKYIDNEARFKYRGGKQTEFALMSRRPGIGALWNEKYQTQTFTHNSVISRGRERKPPLYYQKKFKEAEPAKAFKLKLESIRQKFDEGRLVHIDKYLNEKQRFFQKDNF